MLTDEMHARTLFAMYGVWFGSPVVMFRDRPIDGRKRLAAWEAMAFNEKPPQVEALGIFTAARYLCAAQHYERAAELIRDLVGHDVVVDMLLLPEHMCAPLVALMKRRGPWTIRNNVRAHRLRGRSMQVVKRVRRLYVRAVEDGLALTPEHLKAALGEWL